MKRYLFFLLLSVVAFSVSAQTGAIKVGAAAFYRDNYNGDVFGIGGGITLEYRISRKFTFAGAIDYTKGDDIAFEWRLSLIPQTPINSINFKASTVSFRPECRFYPKKAMKGLFLGLGGGVSSYQYGRINIEQNKPVLAVSNRIIFYPTLMLGLNVNPTPNFCIELCGSLGYHETGKLVPLSLRVGYSF